MPSLTTPIGRVRFVGILEGISFLLLLGIAMPLKYKFGMPEAVKFVGWAHGGLFIAYALLILLALIDGSLRFSRSVLAFVAALVPLGPFLIDGKLARDEAAAAEPEGVGSEG